MERKTVMTEQVLESLEYAFSRGLTDIEACRYAGISHSTLKRYQGKHKEFAEIKEMWKQTLRMRAKLNMAEEIVEKKNVTLSTWLLERQCPEDFSKNDSLRISGGQQITVVMEGGVKEAAE